MKLKNVNFIELHIEKFILAFAVLFSLVVIWIFYLSNPYKVDIAGQELAPNQVPDMVKTQAQQLRSRIDSPDNPLPNTNVAQYTKEFNERVKRAVTPMVALLPLGEPGIAFRDITPPSTVNPEYFITTPPAPTNLQVNHGFAVMQSGDTLLRSLLNLAPDQTADPQSVAHAREVAKDLASLVSAQEPRDFHYVSLSAVFDFDQWKQLLTNRDRVLPDGVQLMGGDWVDQAKLLTDVVVERREQDPVTGDWSEPVTVAALPRLKVFRELTGKRQWTTDDLGEVYDLIRREQSMITRQPFPPITDDRLWLAPGESKADLTIEQKRQLNEINAKLRELDRDIDRITAQEQNLADRLASPGPGPGGAPGPAAAGASANLENLRRRKEALIDRKIKLLEERANLLGEKLPESTTGPVNTRTTPSRPTTNPRINLGGMSHEEMQKRLMADRDRMETDFPGEPGSDMGADLVTPGFRQQVQAQASRVEIQAHDLTVKPGHTYEYRLRVAVRNPLFQRQYVIESQKAKYYNELSLLSAPTEWSEPITIQKDRHFFIVDRDQSGSSVTAEVWRIYQGNWRRGQFVIEPGDLIGGIREIDLGQGQVAEVDLRINAALVDITSDAGPSGLGQRNTRVLLVDLGEDKLSMRSVEEDAHSDIRTNLLYEATQQMSLR